ncbi:tRNA (adenosine(37)-N6)-methyltransferase TrmM, partial [Yersinia enterocolitica]
LDCVANLITADGIFCVVLPHDLGGELARLAVQQDWFIRCQVDIRDRPGKPLHRMLLTLSRQAGDTEFQQLDLRQSEGVYSPEFCALISDFYLNY